MPTIHQLLKEFWAPLLVAVAWGIYNVLSSESGWSTRNFINWFAPAFFFASWLLAQWFRVRKQQRIEGDLERLQTQTKVLLDEVTTKTTELFNQLTGGDSFCYLMLASVNPAGKGIPTVIHQGAHPLYNVSVRIVDIERMKEFEKSDHISFEDVQRAEKHVPLGTMAPSQGMILHVDLPLGSGNSRAFNIFFAALNGNFVQVLRFAKVQDRWLSATRVHRGDKVVYEQVQDGFPRNNEGMINWDAA